MATVKDVAIDNGHLEKPKEQLSPPFERLPCEGIAYHVMICSVDRPHEFCIRHDHGWFLDCFNASFATALDFFGFSFKTGAEHENLSFILPHQTDGSHGIIVFYPRTSF